MTRIFDPEGFGDLSPSISIDSLQQIAISQIRSALGSSVNVHDYYSTRNRQNSPWFCAHSLNNECIQPAMVALALQRIVKHDLEWPRLQQTRYALASDCNKPQPELATMRSQKIQDTRSSSTYCLS